MTKLFLLIPFFLLNFFKDKHVVNELPKVERCDSIVLIQNQDCDDEPMPTFSFFEKKSVGNYILDYANQFMGVKYHLGGMSQKGFDCSGFVGFVFKNFGLELPHHSGGQALKGTAVKRDQIKPGDVVCFAGINGKMNRVGHVGIAVDNSNGIITFIHASIKYGVTVSSTVSKYYNNRFLGARRMLTTLQ